MGKITLYICLAILFLVYSQQCISSPLDLADIQYVINEIEKESKDLVGGAVAIIQNEQVIYKKPFGSTEVGGSLVDDNTVFGLASVSKAITATALAALAEKNIVDFEDKIDIQGINLALKKVLSHTTGYKIRGDSEIEKGLSRKNLLSLLRRKNHLNSTTDQSYFYSNLLYSLTQDYAQSKGYKLEELIKILNIPAYILPINSINLAFPHSKEKDKIAFPSNYQKIVPTSAGIFSSLNGMIEFLHVILGNRPHVLSKESLTQLFTPVVKADDVFYWNILPFKNSEIASSYCLGWRKLTLKSHSKLTLVFHSGYINGATAFVGIIPGLQVGVVILANQSSSFPLKTGLNIWKAVIEKFKL